MRQPTRRKGEAEVEMKFTAGTRGTFLVLKDGWKGNVSAGDTLQRGDRTSKVTAVGFALFRPDTLRPYELVGIAIEDEMLAQDIAVGDVVQFFDPEFFPRP